jgi:hypothetical protein
MEIWIRHAAGGAVHSAGIHFVIPNPTDVIVGLLGSFTDPGANTECKLQP